MKRIMLVTVWLLFVLSFTTETFAQKPVRERLKLHESEVSFEGDHGFIIGRYTWTPLPSGHIWKETLQFKGGFMNYYELNPGLWYIEDRIHSDALAKGFNRMSGVKRKGLSAVGSDVKIRENGYGSYHYIIKSNSNGTCGNVLQFTGDTSMDTDSGPSIGTKQAVLIVCSSVSENSKDEIQKFIFNVMAKVKFDEGKLNDLKAASGHKTSALTPEQSLALERINKIEKWGIYSKKEADQARRRYLNSLTK